jgi:hypothetical protein
MMTKKTALKEADGFAAALEGPMGPRPMQRVVSEFHPFFRQMRASGASWSQISALLASAGVRSRSGQPLSDGVLRAMVSRAGRDGSAAVRAACSHATERVARVRAYDAQATKTLSSPDAGELRRQRLNPDTALSDVAERIRRASALRALGGSEGRG